VLPRLAYLTLCRSHPAARPARPRRRRQGPGDPCPAPPAHRPPTNDPTTQAGTSRPCPARRDQPRPAPSLLVLLVRHATDAAALASAADRRGLDRSPSCIGPAAAGCRRPATGHRPGQGEPALGLPAHQGRAPSTRRAGLGHRDPFHAPPLRAGPGPTAGHHHVASIPARAGRRPRRLRPLHRRHHLAATAICAVLYRTRHPTRPLGRPDRNPDGAWVAQQSRNLLLPLGSGDDECAFLLRDRDAKFCRAFDDVSGQRRPRWCSRRCGRPTRTPSPSDGSARSAPSAWIGC
jgi:hypothetical protein